MYNLICFAHTVNIMKRYFIYGFIGCSMEVFWTGISSLFKGDTALMAHSSIWMITIYGLAIFLEPIQNLLRDKSWFLRGIIYMIGIFFAEYITGYILDIFNIQVWHYTDKLNINGYVTLSFAPLWFMAGLFFEKVRKWLDSVAVVDSELKA